MADMLLDETLHAIQAAIHKPYVIKPSLCDSWTDSQIFQRMKTASLFLDAVVCYGSQTTGNVVILCEDTVVKVVFPLEPASKDFVPEILALEFVRSYTSIPVPLVRRYIQDGDGGLILLEKIEGTRLDKVWPSLSTSQRFGVALTLRDYVRQLRRASVHHPRSHIPGPLGPGVTPQPCIDSNWWSELTRYRPLASSAGVIEFLNERYELPKNPKDRYNFEAQGTFKDSHPLVLSHMDLSLCNIILGLDGRLWLVDFECAGFYPPWFEHVSATRAATSDATRKDSWMNKPGAGSAAASWWRYIPFVTDSWGKEVNLHSRGPLYFKYR